MTDTVLAEYIQQFQSLHTNKLKGKIAPHKPVLLLAVIDLVEEGELQDCMIPLSDTLIYKFGKLWTRYVGISPYFTADITKPFYHMDFEPFWHLVPKDPSFHPLRPQYNINWLRDHYQCARIDTDLFHLLQDATTRAQFRALLIGEYLN